MTNRERAAECIRKIEATAQYSDFSPDELLPHIEAAITEAQQEALERAAEVAEGYEYRFKHLSAGEDYIIGLPGEEIAEKIRKLKTTEGEEKR